MPRLREAAFSRSSSATETWAYHSSDAKERIFGPTLKRLAGRAAKRFESAEFVSAVP
jgi:hypothetical protein